MADKYFIQIDGLLREYIRKDRPPKFSLANLKVYFNERGFNLLTFKNIIKHLFCHLYLWGMRIQLNTNLYELSWSLLLFLLGMDNYLYQQLPGLGIVKIYLGPIGI